MNGVETNGCLRLEIVSISYNPQVLFLSNEAQKYFIIAKIMFHLRNLILDCNSIVSGN